MNLSAPFMYSAAGQQLGTLDKDKQEREWSWCLWTHLVLHIYDSGSSLITFLKASGMHRSMKRLQFSSASASPGWEIDKGFMSSSQNDKKMAADMWINWYKFQNNTHTHTTKTSSIANTFLPCLARQVDAIRHLPSDSSLLYGMDQWSVKTRLSSSYKLVVGNSMLPPEQLPFSSLLLWKYTCETNLKRNPVFFFYSACVYPPVYQFPLQLRRVYVFG